MVVQISEKALCLYQSVSVRVQSIRASKILSEVLHLHIQPICRGSTLVFIEKKNQCVNEPTQFKFMLFKDQLYVGLL